MPVIKPFKGLYANEKNINSFPAKNIENYSAEEIQKNIDSIYYSFLQIIAPTFSEDKLDSTEKYKKVRENFVSAIKEEVIGEDSNSALYVYQQKGSDSEFTGIIGLFDMKDMENNTIRVHENTLKPRVERFANYLDEVHIQSEPILLTYPTNTKVELLLDRAMQSKKQIHYVDEEGIEHNIWRIDNRTYLSNFVDTFKKMEAIYIADGHHRLASSQMYRENQISKDSQVLGNEPYQYVLGFALGSESLKIQDYNRLIKDLNKLSKEEFLEKLSENFTVVEKGASPYFPSQKYHLSMYLDGEFYGLYVNHDLRGVPKGLGDLDTYLFEEYIGKPILGIEDSTLDDRIDFIKGTANSKGIQAIKEKVDKEDYVAGFGFYPIKFNDLKNIADLGEVMPPKSTLIQPKMQTGLLMYNMKKD